MGDGEGALSDAYKCRMMQPDWAKACYRQAAAHMLLQVRYLPVYLFTSQFSERCGYVVMCLKFICLGVQTSL
jgi:hypothetical protein